MEQGIEPLLGLRIGEDPLAAGGDRAGHRGNDIRAKMGGDGSQSRVPGSTTSRAMMSASTTSMPSSAKRLATVVLPLPIPL